MEQGSITEGKMLRLVKEGKLDLSPLSVDSLEVEPILKRNVRPDAILSLRWGKSKFRFLVECKSLSTPKQLDSAVRRAEELTSKLANCYPLVLAPYISVERLRALEKRGVSALDLSGNVLINVPGQALVVRSGAPNRYPARTPIKNVYRKSSSLVARTLLVQPRFTSTAALLKEIESRGGSITQATVSKACSSLEEDLVIERRQGEDGRVKEIRLIQPDSLLDLLVKNYDKAAVGRRFLGKSPLSAENLALQFSSWLKREPENLVLTGASSANFYSVMAREPIQSFYCSNIDRLLNDKRGTWIEEDSRFPNVELLETEDDFVYFDSRDPLVASPIQTYLELMQGDKREKETAEQVRKGILDNLKKQR